MEFPSSGYWTQKPNMLDEVLFCGAKGARARLFGGVEASWQMQLNGVGRSSLRKATRVRKTLSRTKSSRTYR
ncbi:hypothetical protein AUG19_04735 [archaeon 13_1_20CM_2_54_9]|nr:MAG: hypothetical protein AUG19_04735 [archaeon 13_1_20CM_2_54_9]